MQRILRNNKGAAILPILISVIGVLGMWVYLSGTTAQRINDTTGRAFREAITAGDVSDDTLRRAEEHRQNVFRLGRIMSETGNVVNNVYSPGGPSTEILERARDAIIDYQVSADSRSPATASNPLPSNVSPPPPCNSNSLRGCTSRDSCQSAGGTWQPNNTCGTTPVPPCRRNNLSGCTSQSDCENVGGYWYNNSCHANPPPEKCDETHLHLCTTKEDCTKAGGFWYDDHCNASPEECWRNVTQCRTRIECEAAGGYWYDEACHVESRCADGGGVCNCENGQEICCAQICDGTNQCSDGSDEWTCNCDEAGIHLCANGKKICASKVCNQKDDCGDNSDEQGCGSQDSCCVRTRGCPGETASSCAENCCCCLYGEVCDRDNWWNGCIKVANSRLMGQSLFTQIFALTKNNLGGSYCKDKNGQP